MNSFRILTLPLLGLALLATPAAAQTTPARKAAPKATRMVPNNTPAARAADPLRGTNSGGKGNNVYAAPGEPVDIKDNGKNTPPYDGPAAGHGNAPKGMTMPRKQ